MFWGNPPPIVLADKGPVSDAEQGFMGAVEIWRSEINVIGRHKGCVVGISEGHKTGFSHSLTMQSVTLEFHVETVAKYSLHGR